MNICIQKVFVGIENKADLFCKRANRSQVIFPALKLLMTLHPRRHLVPHRREINSEHSGIQNFSFCFCHRIFESSNLFQ